jgi:hypothetical protein
VAAPAAPTVRKSRKVATPKAPRKPAAAARTAPATVGDGPLAGSLLSTQTWKQALAAATGRGMDLT